MCKANLCPISNSGGPNCDIEYDARGGRIIIRTNCSTVSSVFISILK
jgi:hypothetical protein